jgi:prepilin-type N-terminal cleavage/methylation domain-containing protein
LGGLELKNERGFSLLEIIITISLAGIVLAAMSRTIKTGLEIQGFLADKNAAVNWTESVLEEFKNKDIDLAGAVDQQSSTIVQHLEILEAEALPKDYKLTEVEITPYQQDGSIYSGLYRILIEVKYNCKNEEKRHELISLLKE